MLYLARLFQFQKKLKKTKIDYLSDKSNSDLTCFPKYSRKIGTG
ncbi:MAG: hypothetical protein H6Q18_913 [Bacteroidetes bacterium]|nr:hypothetical protein [Bacteroidota bacterium]